MSSQAKDVGTQFSLKGWDNNPSYSASFGLLANKVPYVSWKSTSMVDYRPDLEKVAKKGMKRAKNIVLKALNTATGGAGTAGNALIPVFVDPKIVDISRIETPLVEFIPRVTNLGKEADYNRVTAKGDAVTAGEDAALVDVNDTVERASKSIKYIYSVGRVTGQAQAAIPAYMLMGFQPTGAGNEPNTFSPVGAPNAKQLEVLMRARSLKEKEEDLIVNGDITSDSTEFDGIIRLQSTTNQTDLSGAAMSWNDVEDSIEDAYVDGGRPKIAVCSPAVLTRLRQIMIDVLRIPSTELNKGVELPFGMPSKLVLDTMVGPVVVIPSRFLSNTATARRIYFLDTDFIEMRVLQDMTYEDLAHINDSYKFMLKIYECLIMRAPEFNSSIIGIA
jgi:hypothetical protein